MTSRADRLALALDESERERLYECEERIQRGLQTFMDVGEALQTIRDDRLYRESHGTFEDYCQRRWGWGRNYVNKQIQAVEVVKALPLGTTVPSNEAQARELTPLRDDPEAMAEAWQEAVETAPAGTVTAAHVRGVVQSRAAPLSTDPQAEPEDVPPTTSSTREERLRAFDDAQQPAPTEPRSQRHTRTDVPGLMGQVVSHADRAAKAAADIEKRHLANKPAEAAAWRDSLGQSLQALQRLHDLLTEMSA